PWTTRNNYRWAEAEGTVTFASEAGDNLFVQLADGKTKVQVRTLSPGTASLRIKPDAPVHIQGVCEATHDESTTLVPGLIWVTTENGISVAEASGTNSPITSTNEASQPQPNPTSAAMGGFYATRGVVTFSDRVFGRDCLFVQEGNAAMFVSLES